MWGTPGRWASRAAALELGTDRHSFGYGGTGKKSHGKQFEDYGTAYGRVTPPPWTAMSRSHVS